MLTEFHNTQRPEKPEHTERPRIEYKGEGEVKGENGNQINETEKGKIIFKTLGQQVVENGPIHILNGEEQYGDQFKDGEKRGILRTEIRIRLNDNCNGGEDNETVDEIINDCCELQGNCSFCGGDIVLHPVNRDSSYHS